MRLDPTRSARSARACRAGACSSRRRTARPRPRRWPPRSSSAPACRLVHNQAGREHGRRDRHDAARRGAPARRDRRRARAVRGRRAVAATRWPRSCTRARSCSATCSATSSTATASSRRSPSAGTSALGRPGAQRSCSTPTIPLIADLGRERDAAVLYFGVEDDSLALPGMAHAADAKHCRRCGAPYVFDAVYLGHLGHYHCPSCGQAQARARGDRDATSRSKACARRASRCARPPAKPRSHWRCPASTTSTTRSPPRRSRPRSRSPLESIVAGLQGTRGRVRPRRDGDSSLDGRRRRAARTSRELRILLVKNPAGANEVLRTLALEPGEHDLLGVLNDNIADGRDVSWIWDADFELLAGRIRRVTCSGTRAAELAVRLKYAGIDPARIRRPGRPRRSALREAAATTGSDPMRRAAVRAADLHGDARAARAARRARGGEQRMVVSAHARVAADASRRRHPRRSSGMTWSAAPTAPTCRCGASSPTAPTVPARPILDVGAGTRPRARSTSRRAGHR